MTDYKAAIADELAQRGLAMEFAVVSNSEFLKKGATVADFMRPDRVVIGAEDERATLLMRSLYAPFVRNHDRALVMDRCSAEFTQYAANAMLAARVSQGGSAHLSTTALVARREFRFGSASNHGGLAFLAMTTAGAPATALSAMLRKTRLVACQSPCIAATPAAEYPPPGRGRKVTTGGSP